MKRVEGNIIIAINGAKKILDIFLGPFLTAYFIKTSAESMASISIYYIFAYIFLAISSFIVASIVKSKFKIGMFRIGIILNFIYIMTIIVLKEDIVNNLWLISLLYGASGGAYWLPYNTFIINKVKNTNRTEHTVKLNVVSSLIGVICPIVLGSIITVTNYVLTAVIILVVSGVQIILSFMLTREEDVKMPKLNILKAWKNLKGEKQVKNMLATEFFVGMSVSGGALEILITILIFQEFKTDMKLGIISSLATVLAMIGISLYGKIYKNKDDKKMILTSSIVPVTSLILLLFWQNNITVIIYNFCFIVFTKILSVAKEIRLYNISNSKIVKKDSQVEFLVIREFILNLGRIVGYSLLLIASVSSGNFVLKIIIILLTLSIILAGLYARKVSRFEK